ncbi:hypothetical protein C4N15_07255 [Fusobacterium necrophorum subsp. funduliforme]|nr:hypothetical protein C4N15_07255 [Fusobacterium necrophorum subsp. funduliforme]
MEEFKIKALFYFLYVAILFLAIYARYKNICECQDVKELPSDIVQILVLWLGGLISIGIIPVFKIALVVIISIIIKNLILYILPDTPIEKKKKRKKDKDCYDCNPYQKYL